jgi:2-haloacid dehalogenase
VPAALEALAPRRALAILSNGHPEMLDAVVDHNGLRERFRGGVLSVHPCRTFKPSPKVYALVEEKLGLPRAMVGFVSSNGWDAAGAKTFGFRVFWVNRGAAPVERLGVRPDETVRDLAGLVESAGVARLLLEGFLALLRDRRRQHDHDQDPRDDEQREADRAA